jgi:hypothetical protein
MLAVALIAAGVGVFEWRRSVSRFNGPEGLLQCLPLDRAVKVYIDAAQLRKSGLLDLIAGSQASEDADYRDLVKRIGFDYRTDLDAVAASFLHGDVFLAVRGRFDWKRLADYARSQQGSCANDICTMPASQPNRFISYYQLSSSVLAWAVSSQEQGVKMIGPPPGEPNLTELPATPVWISAPAAVFADLKSLPAGSSILSPLAQAQEAAFGVRPVSADAFEIDLDAPCATPEIAVAVAAKFSATTDLLRKMLDRDHITANPGDLSGVLVAGRFEARQSRVTGSWPVERKFFEALGAGKIHP